MKVISGGQNGVDQAALEAAESVGIPTGGMMPYNFRTLDGPRPDVAERFHLIEHPSSEYPARTWQNVDAADATFQIVRTREGLRSSGERCTAEAIAHYKKPNRQIILSESPSPLNLAIWLLEMEVWMLNVAGNSKKTAPGIQKEAREFLIDVFNLWIEMREETSP